MVPKSVLNDLRRQAVAELLSASKRRRNRNVHPQELEAIRAGRSTTATESNNASPQLNCAVPHDRTTLGRAWRGSRTRRLHGRRWCIAISKMCAAIAKPCRWPGSGNVPIGLATLRIVKPSEEGLLRTIAKAAARCSAGAKSGGADVLSRRSLPACTLIGDFSLNIANELTADLFAAEGLCAAHAQLRFELGSTRRDARPDRSGLVRDRGSSAHADVSHGALRFRGDAFQRQRCHRLRPAVRSASRGTARPRRGGISRWWPIPAAATRCSTRWPNRRPNIIPKMLALGVRHFRVELLRETAEQVAPAAGTLCPCDRRVGSATTGLAEFASAQSTRRDPRNAAVGVIFSA